MKIAFINHLNNLKQTIALSFVLLTGIFSSTPAQAIQFSFTYGEHTSQEVIDGFQTAGNIWSSKLEDRFLDSSCSCEQNTTVNIHIDFTQLANPTALGAARPEMFSVDYKDFLNSSFQNITSVDDLTAFKSLQISQSNKENFLQVLGVDLQNNTYEQNLNILQQQSFNVNVNLNNVEPNSNSIITAQAQDIFQQVDLNKLQNLNSDLAPFDISTFNMRIDDDSTVNIENRDQVDLVKTLDPQTIIDQNGNDNNKKIWLTRANAKALDLIDNDNTESDAEILLSNSMFAANGDIISHTDWLAQNPQGNFLEETIWDFSRVNDPNAEIASNKFDFLSVALHEIGHSLGVVSGVDAFNVLKSQAEMNGTTLLETDIALVSSMDLLRFSSLSKQNGVFDWSSSEQTFLSIDGGQTKLADFANGVSYQTSHWSKNGDIDGNPLGIMHPVLGKGEKLDITDLDLQLLDILGYTKAEQQAKSWLEGSEEQLMEQLATANIQQTTTLFEVIDNASTTQQETWTAKVIQAIMHLKGVDQTTATEQINHARTFIENLRLFFNQTDTNYNYGAFWGNEWEFSITYNYGGSSSSGFNFWQELDTLNATEVSNQITETNNQVIDNNNDSNNSYEDDEDDEDSEDDGEFSVYFNQEYKTASTAEPNIIAGIGILSLFGWLCQRLKHRKY